MVDEGNTANIIIRRAEKSDIPSMMKLIRELALYEHAPEQVTVNDNKFKESGFGNHPVWFGYVAESDHKIVGIAIYYYRYSTWKGPMIYLEDLIITESWRKKGIGKKLIREVIETARKEELAGVMWQVLDWNTEAIRFYQTIGGVEFDDGWTNCTINFNNRKSINGGKNY